MTYGTEYRNTESRQTTMDPEIRDSWSDAGLEVEVRRRSTRGDAIETLTIKTTPHDLERLEGLKRYYERLHPDFPAPTPDVLYRMALDELHRRRCREGFGY